MDRSCFAGVSTKRGNPKTDQDEARKRKECKKSIYGKKCLTVSDGRAIAVCDAAVC